MHPTRLHADQVLVRRTTPGIGDAIMIQPVLARFKALGHTVGFQTAFGDLFADTDIAVFGAHATPPPWQTLDLGDPCPAAAYEASMAPNIFKSRIQLFIEAAGFTFENDVPTLPRLATPDPAELNIGVSLVSRRYGEKNDGWRDYPYPRNLVRALKKLGKVTWFHTEPLKMKGVTDFIGDLRKLLTAIAEMDMMINIDSAACHLAGAMGVPQLGLFGPTDPGMRIAQYPNAHYLPRFIQCPKSYCWYDPCADRYCLSTITPRNIVHRVKGLLNL